MMRRAHLLIPVLVLLSAAPLAAQRSDQLAASEMPPALQDIGFDQRLGEEAALDVPLVDETGAAVTLRSYLGERPVILVPVYYECPMLCTMVLQGLSRGLKAVDWMPGQEFDVVALSFDHGETAPQAAAAKTKVLEHYDRLGTDAGWHFLTGDEAAVRAVTESIGFKFKFEPDTGEYAHAAGLVILTPEGRIARYLYGVDYVPRDVRLALTEASDGEIGGAIDQVLLFCYRYDPSVGKYSAAVLRLIRAGAIATVITLALFIGGMMWRERRRSAASSLGTA